MAAPTFIIQSFYLQGKKLVADQARKVGTAEAAVDGARRLAERKAGVVAYSVVYEPESDVTDDPKILFKTGRLPQELAGSD